MQAVDAALLLHVSFIMPKPQQASHDSIRPWAAQTFSE